ncbi:MAG: polyisoprenoid-binding protein YceI [Planctomycetota bacterium]|jgi:polyisoprenoid-binding protein YceI
MKLFTLGLSSASLAAASLFWLTSASSPAATLPAGTVGSAAAAASAAVVEDLQWGTFTVDTGHSAIGFKVMHMGVCWARGRFNDFTGEIVLKKDPSECEVMIEIESKSIDTASENRDRHLRAPDFFDAVAHPLIGFESTSVSSDGKGGYTLEGTLSLHGVTKDVEVDMALVGAKDLGARMGYRAGFEGEFTIDRTDFGMMYGADGSIGKEVTVSISLELSKK